MPDSCHVALSAFAALGISGAAAGQMQVWVKQFGTGEFDSAAALAPDGVGGVFLAGGTEGALGGPHIGSVDAWVSRRNSAGNVLWTRQLGSDTTDSALALTGDGSGGVYVAGSTRGGLAAGPNSGGYDIWLARYSAAGGLTWINQRGTAENDTAAALAADGSGGMFVAGGTEGSLAAANAGSSDAWLSRYAGPGNLVWTRQFGTGAWDHPYGLAPDGAGGVFIAGETQGALGGPHAGSSDAWIARYNNAGTQLWARHLGTPTFDIATDVAADGAGGAFVAGYTYAALGGTHVGGRDAWLARYNGAGTQLWIRQAGSPSDDGGAAVAPDGTGGVFIAGRTWGSFGGPQAGTGDAWIARYTGAGGQAWVRQFGTGAPEYVWALASDGAAGAFVAGHTSGNLGGPGAGAEDAWVARYTDTCYPDCNQSGSLTVADFACFQTRFVANDPYADCNADLQFTVADFVCFQTRFVAGCP